MIYDRRADSAFHDPAQTFLSEFHGEIDLYPDPEELEP